MISCRPFKKDALCPRSAAPALPHSFALPSPLPLLMLMLLLVAAVVAADMLLIPQPVLI